LKDVSLTFKISAATPMLLRFLRGKGKKIILFYAGRISYSIENYADLLVNAQKIKSSICILKEIKKNPV